MVLHPNLKVRRLFGVQLKESIKLMPADPETLPQLARDARARAFATNDHVEADFGYSGAVLHQSPGASTNFISAKVVSKRNTSKLLAEPDSYPNIIMSSLIKASRLRKKNSPNKVELNAKISKTVRERQATEQAKRLRAAANAKSKLDRLVAKISRVTLVETAKSLSPADVLGQCQLRFYAPHPLLPKKLGKPVIGKKHKSEHLPRLNRLLVVIQAELDAEAAAASSELLV
jgi:hypothetical protein